MILEVDSLSILFNHSVQNPDPFPWASGGFLERRVPGMEMEMEGSPMMLREFVVVPSCMGGAEAGRQLKF